MKIYSFIIQYCCHIELLLIVSVALLEFESRCKDDSKFGNVLFII